MTPFCNSWYGRGPLGRFVAKFRLFRFPVRDIGQRGAVAAMVALSLTALIGFAGLAVEGGTWLQALGKVTTVADLAALAGATALANGLSATAVATDTATRNGFSQGGGVTVTVNSPPASGAYQGNAAAVEVTVTQVQSMALSRLFLSTPPTVRSRAVGAANVDEAVCALALVGSFSMGGNSTTIGQRCFLASNAAAPNGVSVSGSAQVRAAGLITTGICTGCSSGDVWTDNTRTVRPLASAGRPKPIPDPYAALKSWTPNPPACRSTAISFSNNGPTSITPAEGAICSSLSIGPKNTLNLAPGIYYLNNASLDIRGTLTGTGVTLVMTGNVNTVGSLTINAQATVSLRGPTSSLVAGHPEAAGIVIYRDYRATSGSVQLNGGSTMYLFGGLYFPSSDVTFNGNNSFETSTCMSLVAYSLSLSGTSDTNLDVSGCKNFTSSPSLSTVRLVE